MNEFIKEYEIRYFDCDFMGLVRLPNFMAYIAETSSLHSDSLGVGINDLRKENTTWMINSWDISIKSYPKALDKIRVETWAEAFDRFFAYRGFKVYSNNDDLIAKAMSKWLYVDIVKMLPKRIPNEFLELYKPRKQRLTEELGKIKTDFGNENKIKIELRSSDIDNNGHVNNIKYLEWVLNTVDNDFYTKNKPSKIKILYKREIKITDDVFVATKYEGFKSFHNIISNGVDSAILNIAWEESND